MSFRARSVHSLCAIVIVGLALFQQHEAHAATPSVLPPVVNADARLGLCNVLPGTAPSGTPWAQLAYNAGARTNRWEFRWDRMEPRNGTWDFSYNDSAVASSLQYGLDVEGILIGTPKWAAARHQRPGNGLPKGLYLPVSNPRNLWAGYVRATVTHYSGKVKFWEIWNEPDLPFFWSSSPEDYYRLLTVAYTVIKAVDPQIQVVLAGMVLPDFVFLDRLLASMHRDRHRAVAPFDIAAWHAYGPASSLYTNVVSFRRTLAANRVNAPVWVTEDGFPASNPNGDDRQAAYVLQSIVYAYAAGARRVFVYRESDDATPKTWGLLTAGGLPRPGYVAFQMASSYLSHADDIIAAPTAGLQRFVLYEKGKRVTVLWNGGQSDRDVAFFVGRPGAQLIDSHGTSTPGPAGGGVLHALVPGATFNRGIDRDNRVVGGPPIIVVEDNSSPIDLSSISYLAPLAGSSRRITLFNGADSSVTVSVGAISRPGIYQIVELPAHSVRTVELDPVAGRDYSGPYLLLSSAAVRAVATSSAGGVNSVVPSSQWYLASTPSQVSLVNPSQSPASIAVTTYDRGGRIKYHESLHLDAGETLSWQRPGRQNSLALVVQSTVPTIVSGVHGALRDSVSEARMSWFAVRPRSARIAIFNPGNTAVHVDMRFVRAPTLKGEQLRLAPHHSYVFNGHGAKTVVIAATGSVVLGRGGASTDRVELSGQPTTDIAVPAAGKTTGIDLFNPSTGPAHVTLSYIGGKVIQTLSKTLPPSGLSAIHVRQASAPPSEVIIHSDVPVVASPTP